MKARAREGLSGHVGGNRTSLNGDGTFEGWLQAGPSILETTVSDRGTLEDLSQSAILATSTQRGTLLILNGEMSEWSIRHAWKAKRARLTERH